MCGEAERGCAQIIRKVKHNTKKLVGLVVKGGEIIAYLIVNHYLCGVLRKNSK